MFSFIFQVKSLLEAHDGAGKLIAAICAAPTALQAHGIGKGKNLTSYPAFKEALSADYNYTEVWFKYISQDALQII